MDQFGTSVPLAAGGTIRYPSSCSEEFNIVNNRFHWCSEVVLILLKTNLGINYNIYMNLQGCHAYEAL